MSKNEMWYELNYLDNSRYIFSHAAHWERQSLGTIFPFIPGSLRMGLGSGLLSYQEIMVTSQAALVVKN